MGCFALCQLRYNDTQTQCHHISVEEKLILTV
uniref:Uncharacterized protein n=1 Tax=Setaria italica TaxID=4555 RepID=K3Z1U7_SETIT